MSLVSRRTCLQTVAAAVASFFLPRSLRTEERARFWFLHTATGDSWPVTDPVGWTLTNSQQPILARASKGLRTLTAADDQRIIRLVIRRCNLNLIELHHERVVVHHWTQQGKGDLRPFFKAHRLATKSVQVALTDRKRELTTIQTGDAFLFGERLAESFPVDRYEQKWQRQAIEEQDDGQPAPCSVSNYCWAGVEDRRIPWRILKSAWRHENAPLCQNCDKPTLLTVFGYFVGSFYKREQKVIRICPLCSSRFEDCSPWDGPAWMLANLDEPLLPSADIMFGNPVRYTLPWTREGQAHQLNLRLVNLPEPDRRRRLVQCRNNNRAYPSHRKKSNCSPASLQWAGGGSGGVVPQCHTPAPGGRMTRITMTRRLPGERCVGCRRRLGAVGGQRFVVAGAVRVTVIGEQPPSSA